MNDPTYAEFKRKERELDMKYAEWKPTNRRERNILPFIERWLFIGIACLAFVEIVYQVCLRAVR